MDEMFCPARIRRVAPVTAEYSTEDTGGETGKDGKTGGSNWSKVLSPWKALGAEQRKGEAERDLRIEKERIIAQHSADEYMLEEMLRDGCVLYA